MSDEPIDGKSIDAEWDRVLTILEERVAQADVALKSLSDLSEAAQAILRGFDVDRQRIVTSITLLEEGRANALAIRDELKGLAERGRAGLAVRLQIPEQGPQ